MASRSTKSATGTALAERHGGRLVTFDTGIKRLLGERSQTLLDVRHAQ